VVDADGWSGEGRGGEAVGTDEEAVLCGTILGVGVRELDIQWSVRKKKRKMRGMTGSQQYMGDPRSRGGWSSEDSSRG
jgi:hypothetical protein